MHINQIALKNIGPFIDATLEFVPEGVERPPVVLITGENGTGKTIILDAIRGMFGTSFYASLTRNLRRQDSKGSRIDMSLVDAGKQVNLAATKIMPTQIEVFGIPAARLHSVLADIHKGGRAPDWVVDYWPSVQATGSFDIKSFQNPNHVRYLDHALSGIKVKTNVTNAICHFDYLRDSRNEREHQLGQKVYEVLEGLVANSLLNDGKLKYVSRTKLQPIIEQNGREVTLGSLSSGNLYLIQSLLSLLNKMYSATVLRGTPVEELCNFSGVLLIDEAENQLHPKWQKRLFDTILKFFPNLQIIATTHSPFIIASVKNPKLFVCKAKGDHCVVEDVSADYSGKAVDEILMSPLFEETQPFSLEITKLMEQRKTAIEQGDEAERDRIEIVLKEANPSYFSYFDIDKLVEEVLGA